MSAYARLVHSLSDTDSLIPAQAEDRGRTATVLQPGRYGSVPSGLKTHTMHAPSEFIGYSSAYVRMA